MPFSALISSHIGYHVRLPFERQLSDRYPFSALAGHQKRIVSTFNPGFPEARTLSGPRSLLQSQSPDTRSCLQNCEEPADSLLCLSSLRERGNDAGVGDGRCSRENCKYLHPPPHLKTQLEINGRNNLIQQKNMAMLAQQMQLANAMLPGTQLQPVIITTGLYWKEEVPLLQKTKPAFALRILNHPCERQAWSSPKEKLSPMFSVTPSLATNATAATAFNPYLGPVSPGLMQAEILPSAPMLVTSNPNVPVPAAAAAAAQKLMRTDRLEVCREYQRGNCTRGENDCRFAHPADSTMIDTNDNTVTVCMDYIKGRCSREKCKYFHPPAHLQAKIKAAQHQVNQAAAAAAMGIPAGVLPPLPKRPALEKTNGATAMFNAGMFQYQQALANMQFQQQAAFIPSVPMMHGATPATVSAATTSATSVPFATASANQVCSFTASFLCTVFLTNQCFSSFLWGSSYRAAEDLCTSIHSPLNLGIRCEITVEVNKNGESYESVQVYRSGEKITLHVYNIERMIRETAKHNTPQLESHRDCRGEGLMEEKRQMNVLGEEEGQRSAFGRVGPLISDYAAGERRLVVCQENFQEEAKFFPPEIWPDRESPVPSPVLTQ
ncbi:hypothetical protein JZ751_001887, partial [Albula glossodonta]